MKKFFLYFFLATTILNAELIYKRNFEFHIGNESRNTYFSLSKQDSIIKYQFSDSSEVQTNYYTKDGNTFKFSLIDSVNSYNITATIKDNEVFAEGSYKSEEISKTWALDESPWRQSMSYSLGKFVRSDKNECEFWLFRLDNLSMQKLRAVKDKQETIVINEKEYSSQRVNITLAGFLSNFWSANYWFQASDGKFLKFEGGGEIPGIKKRVLKLKE